jgi:predicted nuclease with TOPRIM domain
MATRSLDERVTALEDTVAGLQNLPNELAEFRRETNARFEQIDERFEQIASQFHQVDDRFNKLERHVTTEFEQLYARMRMLHEELIDRIKIGRQGPDDGTRDAPNRRRGRPKR